jgi:hypothetical protein
MPQLSQTAAVAAHQVVHLAARVFQEVQAQAAQETQRWVLLLKGTQAVQQVTEMLAAQDQLVVGKTLLVDQAVLELLVVLVCKMFQAVMADQVLILGQVGQAQLQQA